MCSAGVGATAPEMAATQATLWISTVAVTSLHLRPVAIVCTNLSPPVSMMMETFSLVRMSDGLVDAMPALTMPATHHAEPAADLVALTAPAQSAKPVVPSLANSMSLPTW